MSAILHIKCEGCPEVVEVDYDPGKNGVVCDNCFSALVRYNGSRWRRLWWWLTGRL